MDDKSDKLTFMLYQDTIYNLVLLAHGLNVSVCDLVDRMFVFCLNYNFIKEF